uniref:Uncharacterized protein n=1 Tax=Plectus sambesii TaxID=2011161 RepID=A0A914XSL1_9BILA
MGRARGGLDLDDDSEATDQRSVGRRLLWAHEQTSRGQRQSRLDWTPSMPRDAQRPAMRSVKALPAPDDPHPSPLAERCGDMPIRRVYFR